MDIAEIHQIIKKDGIVFLSYGGFLSQALISAMTEALEKETQAYDISLGVSSNIFTVFIELSQNMMNYSKSIAPSNTEVTPEGLILVSRDQKEHYFIDSQNIVSLEDMELIKPKLEEIKNMDKDSIKKRYRELRRSGKHTHGKGGGIGFYEVAKRCEEISFDFKRINEDKFYFHIRTRILTKKGDN